MDNHQNDPSGVWPNNWIPSITTKNEIREMMIGLGTFSIEPDKIRIKDYPFEPSKAYGSVELFPQNIINIDVSARPLTLRIDDELVFVPATEIAKLSEFAAAHQIRIVKRVNIWDWLLEPFLDTEYTDETHRRLVVHLSRYGLDETMVRFIRNEVAIQMFKYNFDTMLWEWCCLGADDVLRAMRVKYSHEEFSDFYQRVMSICLLPDGPSET